MECDVRTTLKKRVIDKEPTPKESHKFRQVIMACASKLQEKELAIEQMRMEHDATLAFVARQLAFLQANMLKEQQRLECIVGEKTRALDALALENERLRKQNKKLVNHLNHDSSDSSPKSSFSTKSEAKLRLAEAATSFEKTETTTTLAKVANAAVVTPPKRAPIGGPKPPVPSRAGINRLLLQSASLSSSTPPPPPVRSTSLNVSSLERADSGRESDLTSDVDNVAGAAASGKRQHQIGPHDEGFCSSHEDNSRGDPGGVAAATRSSRLINHRSVQKPSDIKLRSKAKATSSSSASHLSVLEEHQVAQEVGNKTTVTYWTGSFL